MSKKFNIKDYDEKDWNIERDSFVFFASFENDAITDDKTLLELYKTIINYGLHAKLPDKNTSDIVKALFNAYKPNMDYAKVDYYLKIERNRKNGLLGGRPPKNKKPKNQMVLSKTLNENNNENINQNENEDENLNLNQDVMF